MKKWIINWNAGWGENVCVVEAETEEEARHIAYQEAREEFENNSEYDAKAWTEELAEELGVE